jgi:hypothetical protein
MGFSLAWFAAQGIDHDDFLERLGFTDTDPALASVPAVVEAG